LSSESLPRPIPPLSSAKGTRNRATASMLCSWRICAPRIQPPKN